jgi:hypothetical protein
MSKIADFIIDLGSLLEHLREETECDNGSEMIDDMARRCLKQRRIIGPEVSATVSSDLEIEGERFTLSLTMHAVGAEAEF